jgi:N-acetylglutamate synthase-like GNAT family acetyltransferase
LNESEYRILDVNAASLDSVGAFCLQSKKNTEGYKAKAEWMKKHFEEGLRYKVLYVNEGAKKGFRARGFIEYMPGVVAWRGISAKDYMVIHCVWVVGRNKGKGYGSRLLRMCLDDAKAEGLSGVCVVTSDKTWLPKRGLFVKNGFELVDVASGFELYTKRFNDKVPLPRFNRISEGGLEKYAAGLTVFKSDQCPYSNASVRHIEELVKEMDLRYRIEHIENCKQAQNMVHPYGTFCVLYNGKIVTHRPIGKKDLKELLSSLTKT